jgi:DNA-binding CsgD family transcriptional regulator
MTSMSVNTGPRTALDDAIATIYANVTTASPWQSFLAKLSELLNARGVVLRIRRHGHGTVDTIVRSSMADADEANQRLLWHDEASRWTRPRGVLASDPIRASLDQYENFEARLPSHHIHHAKYADGSESLLIAWRSATGYTFDPADATTLTIIGGHLRGAMELRKEFLQLNLVGKFQGQALSRMAIGVALVEQSRRMALLNDAAKECVAAGDSLAFYNQELHAIDTASDKKLQGTIREVLSSAERHPVTRAVSLSRRSGRPDLGVVVTGRSSRCDDANALQGRALIFIRDVESAAGLDIALMQQLFSFTRAESKLAVELAKGRRLDDVESELNIRHNTARAHLRSMFLKAGVNRQAELVHLLANSVAPLG